MAINVKDKLVTLESLGVAYSAEQDAREEADQALSTRIDNIVAPEGDPSLTEVSDARVSGSTTHNTLKARLDADKAAVETEISAINESLGDVRADLDAMNTATSEDIGKALKVKTVTSGKVTEWEFGKAGDDIIDELMALKTIEVVTLNTWTEGKYYKTSGSTVNPSTSSDTGIRCMMVAVSEGDALTINAVGGSAARAWCFTDASYSVLSVADTGASYENAVINAPDNAAWCFINDRFSDGVCYQSSILAQRVTNTYTKAQTDELVDEAVTDVAFDDPQSIEWTDGWYITTNGSSVNFKAPVKLATYRTATIPVKAGDKCVVYIQGGNAPRAWCFVNSEYAVISKSGDTAVCDGLTLVAPENAAYLILNDMLMSETDSYYLPTLKNAKKELSEDLAMLGNGAAFAVDATAQTIRSAIFGLLTSAAYVSDEDRSGVYDTLRLWSVSTPTKYGDRVYHTENLVLDGTNPVHTDLVLQNADRDFTITITVKSNSTDDISRIFGIAGAVNNVVYGIALNSYKVMCDGAYTALGYPSNAEAPIKVVLRHTAESGVLKVSHMSTYSKGVYEFELNYTPNSANTFVLSLGATYDNYNKFVGTIHEFSYYSAAWTDDIVNGYMRGTL